MDKIFIKDISIKNFKCFSDQIFRLNVPDEKTLGSGLNVLIGENGCGKTAVLEAINYVNQSAYSSEGRLSINDFRDHTLPISVSATTQPFKCKMPDLYRDCTFNCNGFKFEAKARDRKSPGKLLSSPFSVSTSVSPTEKSYRKGNGEDSGNSIPGYATLSSNAQIEHGEINVFYFDKSRTRQISSGTFTTTFERICDDLNWRFLDGLNEKNRADLTENISGKYFAKVLEIAQKGVGTKLAKEISEFFKDNFFLDLRIDLIDLLHPFTKAFLAVRKDGDLTQIAPHSLGSGVEIVLTLLLLKLIALESKGGIVLLIDEPELHLHPAAQQKLAELLVKESATIQIVVSTHSPYLLRSFMSADINKIILKKEATGGVSVVSHPQTQMGKLFPWSPSWGEINYHAYDMATVEFHNELYGWLQEKFALADEKSVECYLHSQGVKNSKQWRRESNGELKTPYDITLCSYIRNAIHHPENRHNQPYTEEELRQSISDLVNLVQVDKKSYAAV